MPWISFWPAPSRMVGHCHEQTAEEMMKVTMKVMMIVSAAIYPLCLFVSWKQKRLMLLEIPTPSMSI